MNKHYALTVVLIGLFAALSYCAFTFSAGSSVAHKINALMSTVAALSVAMGALVSATIFWKRQVHRNYSILLLVLSSLMLAVTSWFRMQQQSTVIETLENTYDFIATSGPPFPTEAEVEAKFLGSLPESYSTGYWVSVDRQLFELYYHDSSDSFTMRYPSASWEWRGNQYSGPEIAR